MEPVTNTLQLTRQERLIGFTPVQRRQQAPQCDSPMVSTGAPWTTTRCNRLLRPLSSRIALLRKSREHQKKSEQKDIQDKLSEKDLMPLEGSGAFLCEVSRGFIPRSSKEDDPEWTPEYEPRKKLKRTYSSRSGYQRAKETEHSQGNKTVLRRTRFKSQVLAVDNNGCAIPATTALPVTQDSQSRQPPTRANDRKSVSRALNIYVKHDFTRESFRRAAKRETPADWMLNTGLYDGLEALLKATAKTKPQPATGARSLFATCLRKVPDYITEEQHWEDEEDKDSKIDVSTQVYEELEKQGSTGSMGWKPLKSIVRAHGITILGEAIRDGCIEKFTAQALIFLCFEADAYVEAESLLDCFLCTLRPLPKPRRSTDSLFDTALPMGVLGDTGNEFGQWGIMFRRLNKLLQTGIVPVEWMACEPSENCWWHASRSITDQNDSVADATCLVRIIAASSYQNVAALNCSQLHSRRLQSRPQFTDLQAQKLSNTAILELRAEEPGPKAIDLEGPELHNGFSSSVVLLMANMLSLAVLRSEESGPLVSGRDAFPQELVTILAIDRTCHNLFSPSSYELDRNPLQAKWACLLLLGPGILPIHDARHNESEQLRTALFQFIARINCNRDQLHSLALFVGSVTSCCGRNGTKTEFEYLQHLVQRLLQLAEHRACTHAARRSINHIAAEAALDFAERTRRQEHMDWALEVEEAAEMAPTQASVQRPGRTPERFPKKPAPGFRWEESICEWVTKTPAPFAVMIAPVDQDSSGSSNSGEDNASSDDSTEPSEHHSCSAVTQISPQPCVRKRGRPRRVIAAPKIVITSDACRNQYPEENTLYVEDDDSSLQQRHLRARSLPLAKKVRTKEPVSKPEPQIPSKRRRGRPCLSEITNLSRVTNEVAATGRMWESQRDIRLSGISERKCMSLGWEGRDDVSEDELGV